MSRNIPRNKKKSYGNDDVDEVHSTEKEFMKGDPTLRSDHSSVEGGILLKKSDSNVNTNSGFGSSGNDDKSLTSKRKAPSTKSKTVAIIEKLNKKKETEKRAYSKNSIFGARMKQADREEFDDLGDIPDHGGASGRDKSGKFEDESHRNPGNQDQESIDKFLKMRALKKLQHTKKELRIKGIIKSNKTAPKRSKTIRKSKKDEAGDNGLVEETKHPDVTVNNLMNMETIPAMNEDKEDDQVVIQETNKKWMFRYSDPILNQWDTFIIAIAIYNCFTLSFNIGFDPSFAKHPAYITLDVILIIIYILDILQSYITTYLDKDGEEVWDRKKIAKNYIYSGKFGIDVLSTIPFDYFGGPELLAMLGLLKLTRLGRISVIISRLNVNEQLKALIKMAQLTFYLFVVIHIVG